MDTEPITVQDNKGNSVLAFKATCPDCGNDQFMILIINGHNHLQCTDCNVSFCQGGCEKELTSAQK